MGVGMCVHACECGSSVVGVAAGSAAADPVAGKDSQKSALYTYM